MKVAIISANLGSYDPPHSWIEQEFSDNISLDIYRLNDENFPLRHKAMTSRLQCGIPKFCGWEMFPGYDAYLWIDASMAVSSPYCVNWFLDHLKDHDMAVFKHPDRSTVKQEYDFVKTKLREGNKYLTKRYEAEWLDEQANVVLLDPMYRDNSLYASTAFIYKDTLPVRQALRNCWYFKSRFLLHDQLAFVYAINKAGVKVKVIEEKYTKLSVLEYVRNKK